MEQEMLEEGEARTVESRPTTGSGSDVTMAKFLLTSDIPKDELEKFMPVYMAFNKEYAIANIQRFDIPYFQLQFDFVVLCLECGLYDYARETMAKMNQELKLTRSIDGLQLKLGVSGVTRVETIQRLAEQSKRKSGVGRLGRLLGKKPPVTPQQTVGGIV